VRKAVSKMICIKNFVIWAVISLCCILAIGNFIKLFINDISEGKEIFLPGVIILVIVVSALLFFSITRIIKYVKLIRSLDKE
jgi:uncharacterized membrane protein